MRTEVDRQARRYGCKGGQLALAWLLKHPAGIEPVIGSTSATRIAAAVEALAIDYRRDDWY